MDKDLLLLVQGEVRDVIKEYRAMKSQLNLLNKQVAKLEEDVVTLKDHDKCKETRLHEHHERLGALEEKLQEATENRSKEIEKVLERLLSFEAQISIRLQTLEEKVDLLEQTQTVTAHEMELLKHSYTNTADKVELLQHSHTKTVDEVELLKHSHTNTTDEVKLLKHSHTKTTDEVDLLKHSHTETAAKVDQLDQRCNAVEEIGQELKSLKTQKEKLGKLSV